LTVSNTEALTNWAGGAGPVRDGPDSNTPSGYAQAWLEWLLNVKGRSLRTIDSYGIIIRQWLAWADDARVDQLYPELEELEAFITRPRIRQGHGQMGSPATRRQDVVVLSQWFQWLTRRGLVNVDPTLDLMAPSVKPNMPKPIPDEAWLVLWSRAAGRLSGQGELVASNKLDERHEL
jgi:site-specific recombinase XerC